MAMMLQCAFKCENHVKVEKYWTIYKQYAGIIFDIQLAYNQSFLCQIF